MATVSLVTLTWNRASTFKKAIEHSLGNAGRKWDELIWVDNGSRFLELNQIIQTIRPWKPTSSCIMHQNTGMQRGFNTGMSLCRSDYIALLPPDCLYPDGWLETLMTYVETLPNTGMVSIYSVPIENYPERWRGSNQVETLQGLQVLRAMPMETPCFKRELLSKVGYWREDFGLYGWGDVEWILRCERYMNEVGINYYVIPNVRCNHLGSEGAQVFKEGLEYGDTREYWEWKKKQAYLQSNLDLMNKCQRDNFPFYSPF